MANSLRYYAKLRKRIEQFCKDNLLTRREFAARAGVTPETVSRFMNRRTPTMKPLTEARIEKILREE